MLRKRLRRGQVAEFFANLPRCIVGLEACGGAHYWTRVLSRFGHDVRLLAPQFVKPYVKSNKNDAADAEAICEAVGRPSMRFVPAKSVEQQDMQALHRIRSRLIGSRTQLGNQIRGLLAEYGIVLPLQLNRLTKALPTLLEEGENELTSMGRALFASLFAELLQLEERIAGFDRQLAAIYRRSPQCRRIAEVEGIGPVTATAIVAAICDGKSFTNGRQLSAWLGLVRRRERVIRAITPLLLEQQDECSACSGGRTRRGRAGTTPQWTANHLENMSALSIVWRIIGTIIPGSKEQSKQA